MALPFKTNEYFIIMIEELKDFILPIALIILGIWLKKELLPNTDNRGKLWLLLIVTG
jgi:predicted permease